MAGVVHIPWYATVFRGNRLAAAVAEVAEASLRYGATQYRVHRSREDAYRITQMVWFESRLDWDRYWEGPEMIAFRAAQAGKGVRRVRIMPSVNAPPRIDVRRE